MTWETAVESIHRVLDFELFELAGTTVSPGALLTLGAILLAFLWISRLLRRGLAALVSRGGASDEGTVAVMSRLLHYTMIVVGLSVGLHTVGVNLSALFAAGALFAVAIGFAMQNIVANFVSGVILLVERVIKPGDILEIEGQMVRVLDLGIRAAIVRTLNDEDLVIPNSLFVQSTVTNYTLRDDLCRLRVEVGVAYSSKLSQVRRVLQETADAFPSRLELRDPVVLLSEFGSSSVNYEVSIWTDDPWSSRTLRSGLREAIWDAFQTAGVTIAFPQLDVHFDEAVGLREIAKETV
jgi:small-conductance mechanosensitive channel